MRSHTAMPALFDDGGIADKLDLFNLVCVPGETEDDTIKKLQAECKEQARLPDRRLPRKRSTVDNVAPASQPCIGAAAARTARFYFPVGARARSLAGRARFAIFRPAASWPASWRAPTRARGVWKAPAGTDAALNGAVGFKSNVE